MAKRFGRNQKRKLRTTVIALETALASEKGLARQREACLQEQLAQVLRDQLTKGTVPLEVEHFISPREMNLVMHAIFDERRANLHYQHEVGFHETRLQRDKAERESLGLYLGRAIADRLADAYAGRETGTSRRAA